MKIVVFDLYGDYGHFRVPYTTSSPITFPVPPKTALYGIIGAILGYDKNSYLEIFAKERWHFAVSLRKSVSKFQIPENFINTKAAKMFARMPKNKSCRTQINMDFLKNPYFRIYVTSDNENELNRLESLLKEHKSVYTPVLGLSECLANFEFIGSFSSEEQMCGDFVEICSILPLSEQIDINFLQQDKKFLKVHIPTEFNNKRELIESKDFVIEATGKTIDAKVESYISISEINENVVMF